MTTEEAVPMLAWCFGCHGLRPMTLDVRLRVTGGASIREARCRVCGAPVWRVGGAAQQEKTS